MDENTQTVNSVEPEQQSPAEDAGAQLLALAGEKEQLIAEKADLQDRLMRRQAEFENFRRRVERERSEVFDFSAMETIRPLLAILDDFERALKTETADREYAKGMELIYQRMLEALRKLGLEPLAASGQSFDPNLHHAVEMVQTDEHEDHSIIDEYQRGYNFKGRLLRPAMVKVAVRP
jgi:molecular chaperone GrpE